MSDQDAYAKVCMSCAKPCKQASWCEILQCGHYEMSEEWAAAHKKKQRAKGSSKRAAVTDELQQPKAV